jgi:outer membrane protein OmpA-like peptidoglycan-associated protein
MIVAILPAALALAGPAPSPKIVPFPSDPPGPRIRRVTHDALKPVHPGDRVVVTVVAEPKLKVAADLGAILSGVACSPKGGDPGTYACEAVIPEGGTGPQRVKATVTDSKARSSWLSAPLPVVVEKLDPWSEPNALNVRLVPAFFADGSADLDASARADLAKDAESIKAHPDLPLAIEGHGDAAESGDLDALSLHRAEAVRDHLAAIGIAKERMTVRAMGAKEPVVSPKDAAARPMNRRAMVLFEPRRSAGSPQP